MFRPPSFPVVGTLVVVASASVEICTTKPPQYGLRPVGGDDLRRARWRKGSVGTWCAFCVVGVSKRQDEAKLETHPPVPHCRCDDRYLIGNLATLKRKELVQ